MPYLDRRIDTLMRVHVHIALANRRRWGTRHAAEYLMRRGVQIETTLRALAGRRRVA